MIETLNNIGNIIRNDNNGKLKYHPLIRKYTKEKFDQYKKTYKYFQINVNTTTNSIEILDESPFEEMYVLKYDIGGKNFPYLVGNYEILDLSKKTLNLFDKCKLNVKTRNPIKIINDYSLIIDNNINLLKSLIKQKGDNDELIIRILINNKEFYEYEDIINWIDDLYISEISTINKSTDNILLTNTLFGFFKSSGDIVQCPNLDPKSSYKSLSIDNLKLRNLIYSTRFHKDNAKYIVSNYQIVYLPNFSNMTYDMLNRRVYSANVESMISEMSESDIRSSKNTDIDNELNFLLSDIENTKDELLDHGYNVPLGDNIKFDLIFKLKGGNTTNDILYISNFNSNRLIEMNNNVNSINKKLETKFNIKYSFINFFKKETSKDVKEFSSFIFKWITEIFQNKYFKNLLIDKILIDKIEYLIRNSKSDDIRSKYNNLIKNYKFLRYMEKNGEKNMECESSNISYIMGRKIGEYSKFYQDDRSNLEKYVVNFNGHISRKIKTIRDVSLFFKDFQERLVRNGCRFITSEYTDISVIISNFNDKFNKDLFIRGYFDGQYAYNNRIQ